MAGILPSLLTLVLSTLITQLVNLAYNANQQFLSIVVPSTIVIVFVTTPLAASGLKLGGPIGLGAPLLASLLAGQSGSRAALVADARLATVFGLGVGAFLLALRIVTEPYLPAELMDLGNRGVLGSFLVAISAAVTEEVWLRLGVMSLVAWLLVRVTRQTEITPMAAWPAIAVAAVLFAAIHLPQLAASGAASPIGVAGTMFGNTLVGLVCGWLYWRRSLIAAIVAHFVIDLVLHVVPAMVSLPT